MCLSKKTKARGVTLMELVVSMVIMGIVLVGVLQSTMWLGARAADPFVLQQATMIAESYIQEMADQAFLDPTGGNFCPSPPHTARNTFDNLCDYDNLIESPPQDPQGNALHDFSAFTVSVSVDRHTSVSLGPSGNTISNPSTGNPNVALITVHVTHNSTSQSVHLSFYRTRTS